MPLVLSSPRRSGITSYDGGLTNGGPPGSRETNVVVRGLGLGGEDAAVPAQRLREMICADPALHRAAGSALDNLAGQDGPYSSSQGPP